MKFKTGQSLGLLVVATAMLAWGNPPASAQAKVMNIAQGASLVNHYPGPDGLIGNGDDVVSSALSPNQQSAPNANGSLGHNSFLFAPFGPQDPNLPTGFDAITFVDGTVTIDVDAFTNGGGPIVSALDITSGTEPFPGHGAYTSTITAVNSGSYNPATGAFTLNVDISYTIFGTPSTEPGVVLNGTALYRTSGDFGTPTGNTYVDDIAIPFAQAAGADGMVFFTGTGTLPNLGYPITASLVALDGGGFQINAGLNDAWFNLATAGQGVFVNVFPDLGKIFIAMFTFDTERPPEDVIAILGGPGQRWVTGLGDYAGNEAVIEMELTSGGIFDSSDPAVTQTPNYGTVTLTFNDCNSLTLTYSFPTLGLSGTINLTRVVNDNVALCEELNSP